MIVDGGLLASRWQTLSVYPVALAADQPGAFNSCGWARPWGTVFWIPEQTTDERRIPPRLLGSADSNGVDPKTVCSEDVGEKTVAHHHCLLGRGIELLYQLEKAGFPGLSCPVQQ